MKKYTLIFIMIIVAGCSPSRFNVKINDLCVKKNTGETRINGSEAWFYLKGCDGKQKRWKLNNAQDNSQKVPAV